MGPMSKDFSEKVTHLGGTSPYALTCEYPPPPVVATLPVTSCSCERSCSTLRRLKTFNRTTIMLDERLNGLAFLYVHRQVPVDHDVAVDQFANAKPRGMQFNTFMNN